MNRTVLAGTFLPWLALAAAATPARADDWSKTYQISGRADLRVSTDDGDVTIVGSDQKQIDAHVTTEGYKIASNEVRIEESQNGDHVVISVKLPHMNWSFWGSKHKSVKVELHVPRELELDVQTSDGNVVAQNVAGRIHFNTGDGNVTATGVHGDIHLRSGDGHINSRLPGDLNADVEAHTGDGSITVNLPLTVSGSLSHSSVHGKLNAGGGTLSITSGDGSIHLAKL